MQFEAAIEVAPTPKVLRINAHQLFASERKPELRMLHPGVKPAELVKLLSAEWKALDDNVKADYEKRAAEQKRQLEEAEEKAKAKTQKRASSSAAVMDDREDSRRKLQRLDSGVAAWLVSCVRALSEEDVCWSEEGRTLTPGIMSKFAVKLKRCKRNRFPLSVAIVRQGAVYCSEECANFSQQYIAQTAKWDEAARAMRPRGAAAAADRGYALFPGDWAEGGMDRCSRCDYKDICTYYQSSVDDKEDEEDDENRRFPPDLCALCAQLVSRHLAVNQTWQLPAGPPSTTLALRWNIPLTKPDNFVPLVLTKPDEINKQKVCQIGGPRCYGLEWFGPFCQSYLVEGTSNTTVVCCVFCADDHDAEIRQRVWDSGVAQTALVEDCGLVVDVLSVIASYLVGCFLVEDNIAVFDWTLPSSVPRMLV